MKGRPALLTIILILTITVNGCSTTKKAINSTANMSNGNKSGTVAASGETSTVTAEQSAETNPPTAKPSPSFTKFFPDPVLAQIVADTLHKDVTGTITKEELAAYTGELVCLPGDLSDLSGIGYLTGLTSLSCSKNNVKKIPPEIKNLVNLEILNFGKSYSVEVIPPEIGSLKKLKNMSFYLTSITTVPKEIGNLKNLTVLVLGANQIESVPKELGRLTKLQCLDLHANKLTSLPDGIYNLTDLRELDLSHNTLSSLPSNFGSLTKLTSLNLFNNKIKSLPKSMTNMLYLDSMNVYDNYELSENYRNFMPAVKSFKIDIQPDSNCIIELPINFNSSTMVCQFKNEDISFKTYYNYAQINPKTSGDRKLILNKKLFSKKGQFVFRLTEKRPGHSPLYNIYIWHINVS